MVCFPLAVEGVGTFGTSIHTSKNGIKDCAYDGLDVMFSQVLKIM